MATITPAPAIYYPESDGKPMGETDIHIQIMIDLIEALRAYYRDNPTVYVAGNMLLYYEEGNPRKSVAPDTFVVFGVAKYRRRTYRMWEEGRAPAVVIEVTSASTRDEDLGYKRELYATLGVREYFLFDPLEEYLTPSLQGHELVDGEYYPLAADLGGRLISRALGMRLERDGERLRLVVLETGRRLPWAEELAGIAQAAEEQARAAEEQARAAAEQARAAEEQARVEADARRAVETELARLRAEVARLRGPAHPDDGAT